MYLYHLTLQKPTAITHVISGNFSAPKAKEIVVARGKILELLRIDSEVGRLVSVFSIDVFGIIRSICPFRLTGGNRDYIIIGSDSGKISILEFDNDKKMFKKVHEETFGRSGCRRIVPGQYLAVDPRGRAVMISAIEKQKFVYILNRDSAAKLTISSPLEAHKSRTICFSVIGVDVGFDNPIFACIEVDYGKNESTPIDELTKTVTFYELDLGLNHVVRKWNDAIDPTSNMLIQVPGGTDGPGGVIVCAENYIYWKNMDHEDIHVAIPKRNDMDDSANIMIVSHTVCKLRDLFFFIVQSEYGDLYKLELIYDGKNVSQMKIKYFDTVPLANSLTIIRPSSLFVASEKGNHMLYLFKSIGEDSDDEDNMEITSNSDIELFTPRKLKNLELVEQLESLTPISGMLAKDITKEMSPQLYTICGATASSSLRVLRHGLEVTEMAVSGLPAVPSSIWAIKVAMNDKRDRYIVVSFVDGTLVLSVGESVEETDEEETGIKTDAPTLNIRQIGNDGILQVLPTGLNYIVPGRKKVFWPTPQKKQIVKSAINQRQVVIALTGGEIFYFQVDMSGQLVEEAKKELGHEVASIDIAPVPQDRSQARFLAIGDLDGTVRILSLFPDDCLQTLSIQSLPSPPVSLCFANMRNEGDEGTLFLNIGLQDGVLLRIVLDEITGELSDIRRRFLGLKPVKLFPVTVNGLPAVLAISSRSWICYNYQARFYVTPLSTNVPYECASNFSSDECPEGMVTISEDTLRVIGIERLGEVFNQKEIPLKYTPRKFIIHPQSNNIILIETDHNSESQPHPVIRSIDDESEEIEIDWIRQQRLERTKPGPGKWASCVSLVCPIRKQFLDFYEIKDNEAAFSICNCVFHDRKGDSFIIVGVAKNMTLQPRTISGGALYVFQLGEREDGTKCLRFVHKTDVDEVPTALCAFQGRLLVGMGNILRIYDLGKKKLLRKCENKSFPTFIKSLHAQGDRIVVGDMNESFHFVKYRRFENQLFIFADDTAPRNITASCMLDYDTVAGGDKFGNLFICRLPKEIADEADDDPSGAHLRNLNLNLNGAPHKINEIVQFHVGEIITSLTKTSLIPGGADIILYATVHGGIGAFVPFVSREDVDFFSHLEMHMRQVNPPLCGRDSLSYRSYYYPVKNVIDGDLCEQYTFLEMSKRESVATELDRKPSEVMKKLEDMRNRCL